MEPTGVVSAIVTPFSSDGEEVEWGVLRALVDQGVHDGLGGFVPCGGTGEFATLSSDVRRGVVETVCEQSGGRAAVIAQVGATSTREAVAHARHAESAGADAIMLATPYYEPIAFAQVLDYYRDIAEATALPICVYNFAPAMGVSWDEQMLEQLVHEIDTVRLIKDSSGDFAFLDRLVSSPLNLDVFCGEDILAAPALLAGCRGLINGGANFLAPAMVAMHKAAQTHDVATVNDVAIRMTPLLREVIAGPYIGMVKAVLGLLGFDVGPVRAPYPSVSDEQRATLGKLVAATDANLLSWRQ